MCLYVSRNYFVSQRFSKVLKQIETSCDTIVLKTNLIKIVVNAVSLRMMPQT